MFVAGVNCEIHIAARNASTVECDFDRAEKGIRELVFMRRWTTCFGNERAPRCAFMCVRLFAPFLS